MWVKSTLHVLCGFYIYYRPHPKDGGRYCFQVVSPHLDRGGGTPSQVQVGGYPISGLRGYPHPRSGGYPCPRSGGYPHPRSGGVPLSQVWGGTPSLVGGVPHLRSGVPHLRLGGTPIQVQGGYPQVPCPWNSKHLLWLRSGQYASCVHTGGLSC